jgi:hypothetical protein
VSTHRWIPHAFAQARTGPVKGSPQAQRTDALTQAARGLLIVAFVLGALGTAGTVSPGHASADPASGHQPVSHIDLAVSLSQVISDPILPNPWMY